MPFQKGNKLSPGGKVGNRGGRRLTAAEIKIKVSFLEALEREREKHGESLAKTYFAMASKDPATMRHAVDKVLPNAKQEVELTGALKIVKVHSFTPDAD